VYFKGEGFGPVYQEVRHEFATALMDGAQFMFHSAPDNVEYCVMKITGALVSPARPSRF
jgi:hypothetical protein